MNQNPSPAGPALRDLWIELQLAPTAPSSAVCSEDAVFSSGSEGSGGPGSGGSGGYGLGLIVPEDRFSAERILRIMHDLCERDRKKQER